MTVAAMSVAMKSVASIAENVAALAASVAEEGTQKLNGVQPRQVDASQPRKASSMAESLAGKKQCYLLSILTLVRGGHDDPRCATRDVSGCT